MARASAGVHGSSAFTFLGGFKGQLEQQNEQEQQPARSLSSTRLSIMAVDRRRVAVFGAAFVLRLLLICLFPSLPDLLTGRVEVSTPVNSFKRRMS